MTIRTRAARTSPRLAAAFAAVLAGTASVALAGDCVPTWDGSIGDPGIDTGIMFDLTPHEGTLVASGSFTSINDVSASRIAAWDGAAWSPLGTGLQDAEGYAVASFGGDLYAAGYFNSAGNVPGTAKLARWDGSAWNSVGAQLESFTNQLWDLETWDGGTGEALYVAGNYTNIGGVSDASFIAKWDGSSYAALGAPIAGNVPLIVFAIETGLRKSEQVSLVRGQINLVKRELMLGRETKSGRGRVVPLSNRAVSVLEGQLSDDPRETVFRTRSGRGWVNIECWWNKVRNRSGVYCRWHDLRHTFASRWLQDGGEITVLQKVLGHSSLNLTMRYAHLVTDNLHAETRRLDEVRRLRQLSAA